MKPEILHPWVLIKAEPEVLSLSPFTFDLTVCPPSMLYILQDL